MMEVMLQLVLFLTIFKAALSQTLDCGSIGSQDANRPSTPARVSPALYLSTDNPATCRGNVTRWRYCYYASQDDTDSTPSVQFAVYRRNGTNDIYDRVSNVFTAFEADDDSSFDCRTLQLRQNQFVEVEIGDVIGACIYQPSSFAVPLNVVGARVGGSLTDAGACSFNSLPRNVSVLPVNRRDGLILHVYASEIFQTLINPPSPNATINPPGPGGEGAGESEAGIRVDLESAQGTQCVNTESDSVTEGIGNGTNPNPSSVADGINLGIIVAIVVVIILTAVLLVIVAVFVVLVVRHCRKAKHEHHISENPAFVALGSSRTYDVPEITMSIKQEVQDQLQISSKGTNERVYDYANLARNLERSEYVSMGTDPAPSPVVDAEYSHLEPLMPLQDADYSRHLERNKQEDIYGSVGMYAKPASVETELYAQLRSFNIGSIPAEDISVTGHLGSGYFGQVKQGVWVNGDEIVEVAMKTLNKQTVREMDKVKFLQEAAIMAQFRHPNIVSLYGVSYSSKDEPMMLVLELVDRGNLKDYLLFLQPASFHQQMENLNKLLLKFSQQVALGMQYLSARGYIHRDLAARNVLVNKYGICKITDFGMSRDLAEENYYVANNRDAIPVKWTAPEALYYKKYSTASDVWSYGCLLYEIWSLGHTPFADTVNREVIKIISSGKRLASPPGCPEVIYELMIRSWNPSSSDRPKFREMVLVLIAKEEDVLFIPPEALRTHRLAGVLGSPLESGEKMYPELQRTYCA